MKSVSDLPSSCGVEMLPGGDPVPVGRTAEGQRDSTPGDTSVTSAEETRVTRQDTIPADLITSQPLPAAAPFPAPSAGDASQGKEPQVKEPQGKEPQGKEPQVKEPQVKEPQVKEPQGDVQKLCPHCGGSSPRVPEQRRLPPVSPALSRLQGSSLSVQSTSSSKRSKSRESLASSRKPAAAQDGVCLPLVLACLSCQCSVLLLGLLEACSFCCHSLCSSCCHCCAACCAAIQEAPVEELNCHAHCHSVLFESCCEPTECLEFCLECCQICHHS